MARDRGVALALESPLPAEELAKLVDAAGSAQVGVYYDVGNAIYLGFDPAEEIETLDRRILAVHVKDTAQMLGDAHLGQGRLDLAASLEALKRIGYEGWLMLETPGGDEAAVREDIRILGQYL
jgi:sugar phosphate isomerase/epimerase